MPVINLPEDDELRNHPLAQKRWTLTILFEDKRRIRVYHAVPPRIELECPSSKCGAKGRGWLHQKRPTKSVYRDIPQDGKLIQLRVLRRRLQCSRCGLIFTEHPKDLDEKLHITADLLSRIRKDLRHFVTLSAIAQEYGLSISGVKKIEKVIVEREDEKREEQRFSLPSHVGFHSAHIAKTDCCLLRDPDNQAVWELVPSQETEGITRTIERLCGRSRFEHVRLVSMPLNQTYRELARKLFPRARILVPKYYLEVMANQSLERTLVRDSWGLPVPKDAKAKFRSLLFPSGRRLSARDKNRLDRLMDTTLLVRRAHIQKELFLKALSCKTRNEAEVAFAQWWCGVPQPVRQDFEPLILAIRNWEQEICEAFDHKLKDPLAQLDRDLKRLNEVGRGYSVRTIRGRLLYLMDSR